MLRVRSSFASLKLMAAALLAVAGVAAERAQATAFFGPSIIGHVATEGTGYRYSYTIDYTQFDLTAQFVPPPAILLSLPIFDAGAASDFQSPSGWIGSLQPANGSTWGYLAGSDPNAGSYDAPAASFQAPPLPYVANWIVQELSPTSVGTAGAVYPGVNAGDSLGGFTFFSPYGPSNAPGVTHLGFIIEFGAEPVSITEVFDPPVPNSPGSPFAQPNGVPEPVTAGLGGIALSALALGATRRRRA